MPNKKTIARQQHYIDSAKKKADKINESNLNILLKNYSYYNEWLDFEKKMEKAINWRTAQRAKNQNQH